MKALRHDPRLRHVWGPGAFVPLCLGVYLMRPMSDSSSIQPLLALLAEGQSLSADQAYEAFECVMAGAATEAQTAALLMALRVRPAGPTIPEITGAARAMREHATKVTVPEGMTVVDTCGTGGDSSGSFNISTAAALIAAGGGATVAKHGNRSVTSNSGSSQVLEHLGVQLGVDDATQQRCLRDANICFCFAAAHHPSMKHAAPVRQQLGIRTLFNLLGPLTNPAGAKRQIMGIYDPGLTEPIAQVLMELGSEHVMVVHGSGLDEITTTGPTQISTAQDGRVETVTIEPADLGLEKVDPASLHAADVEASARIIRSVLEGEPGPARDIATLNAAAALVVAGVAADLADGLQKAGDAIDSGAAKTALASLVEASNA
jgi:anthranilate phosphoribosyltransferase